VVSSLRHPAQASPRERGDGVQLRQRGHQQSAVEKGPNMSGRRPAVRGAVAVDPELKARNLKRLRRIEGQVRGLQKMVEDDRYCADILTQISSVHEALRSVGRELMRNHLRHCAAAAIRSGPEDAEPMYDEIVDLMYKHSR